MSAWYQSWWFIAGAAWLLISVAAGLALGRLLFWAGKWDARDE